MTCVAKLVACGRIIDNTTVFLILAFIGDWLRVSIMAHCVSFSLNRDHLEWCLLFVAMFTGFIKYGVIFIIRYD